MTAHQPGDDSSHHGTADHGGDSAMGHGHQHEVEELVAEAERETARVGHIIAALAVVAALVLAGVLWALAGTGSSAGGTGGTGGSATTAAPGSSRTPATTATTAPPTTVAPDGPTTTGEVPDTTSAPTTTSVVTTTTEPDGPTTTGPDGPTTTTAALQVNLAVPVCVGAGKVAKVTARTSVPVQDAGLRWSGGSSGVGQMSGGPTNWQGGVTVGPAGRAVLVQATVRDAEGRTATVQQRITVQQSC